MGALKILKVSYSGDLYEFESPLFNHPLSIIEGPNGSGKSTFFNLIYYGLGGKVEEFEANSTNLHPEIALDKNNSISLQLMISGQEYSVIRRIQDNLITVGSLHKNDGVEEPIQSFPLTRRESSVRTFSDWLLEKLNIPVVDIFQGGKLFKLNFSDLARLIYHNQKSDPHGVYKPADNANFISDSLEIRRAIFQILVGKTLLKLYEAIGKLKLAERSADGARNVLREYQDVVREVLKEQGFDQIQNALFLKNRIAEIDSQIDKLLTLRGERIAKRPPPNELMHAFDVDKRHLGQLDAELREINEALLVAVNDKSRLADVIRAVTEDVERVSKVIFTHKQLNLFSGDTCPYCLKEVDRPAGRCVCGSAVDENDYQRFFYSQSEYIEILRSKQKSLQTVVTVVKDLDEEIESISNHQRRTETSITTLKNKIDASYAAPVPEMEASVAEDIEDNIFDLRLEQNTLFQALKMEQNIERLQRALDTEKTKYTQAKIAVERLELDSREELNNRIGEFNQIYNGLMTQVLSDCRIASINPDTYLPAINNGLYREASAEVPKRFLYYLTLLKLSLKEDIPFPRLLLVDTPETAGIDRENLNRMLAQLQGLSASDDDYQVLLSTGKGKYPPEFSPSVVIKLDDDDKLLRRRANT